MNPFKTFWYHLSGEKQRQLRLQKQRREDMRMWCIGHPLMTELLNEYEEKSPLK